MSSSAVRIVTDSSCDLPDDVVEELGITIVPLSIRFGDEEFIDRQDLTPAEFWTKCVNSPTLPETAAPAPGLFETAYRDLAAGGASGVVVINLSAALSATMQSAELAARTVQDDAELDLDVRVVDSRSVTIGLGTMVIAAARAAREGASAEEIEALAHDLADRTRVFGTLDTLENLKKGGRIGNAQALLGTALSIKPMIEVANGQVEEAGKQRTRSKALKHLITTLRSYGGEIDNLAIMHADCSDVDAFVEMVQQEYDGDIVVGDIGPVVGAHAGRGTIGFAFQVRS